MGCQLTVDLTDWGRLLLQSDLENMEILAAESAVSAVRFQGMLALLCHAQQVDFKVIEQIMPQYHVSNNKQGNTCVAHSKSR